MIVLLRILREPEIFPHPGYSIALAVRSESVDPSTPFYNDCRGLFREQDFAAARVLTHIVLVAVDPSVPFYKVSSLPT